MSTMETTSPGIDRALIDASEAERRGVEKALQRLSRMGGEVADREAEPAEFADALEELRHG